jgi:hypothetical protein
VKVTVLELDEWLELVGRRHNLPIIQDQKEQNQFQAEIRCLYDHLVESLSTFGQEGDYYNVSDFAVRPDLRDRSTVKAPNAAHFREFDITILTRKFFHSEFLGTLYEFLMNDASAYRVILSQDFDPQWTFRMCMQPGSAAIYCTNEAEFSRKKELTERM